MKKIYQLPKHKPPILHEKGVLLSYEQCYQLGKIYKEIIGINNIDHFSLNVVDLDGEMSILSYKPQIAYNIFKDGTYLYNGSISSTFYDAKECYTWDETYDPNFYHQLKNNMERKNGIEKGVVLVKKIDGLTLLYSFATKKNSNDFLEAISAEKDTFYDIGNHCFELISPILKNYGIGSEIKKKYTNNLLEFKRNG